VKEVFTVPGPRHGLAFLAVLLTAAGAVAPQATGATDLADVGLTVHEWVAVAVSSDIMMTTVTPDWFGNERQSSGTALVDVYTNTDATLRCPTTITLMDHGSYAVDAAVSLLGPGPNPVYYSDPYWCLDFSPGAYPGQTTLTASIKKVWTVSDIAGTYTGTVTLELAASP